MAHKIFGLELTPATYCY